jgi:hypothetical protein
VNRSDDVRSGGLAVGICVAARARPRREDRHHYRIDVGSRELPVAIGVAGNVCSQGARGPEREADQGACAPRTPSEARCSARTRTYAPAQRLDGLARCATTPHNGLARAASWQWGGGGSGHAYNDLGNWAWVPIDVAHSGAQDRVTRRERRCRRHKVAELRRRSRGNQLGLARGINVRARYRGTEHLEAACEIVECVGNAVARAEIGRINSGNAAATG